MKKIIIFFFLSFLFNSISLASTDSNEKIVLDFLNGLKMGSLNKLEKANV
ncbi:MAG: hypothetical protein CM1200mP13_09440 [Candidatus Pelagibacterales bacterium]|nr:MAG: hypothetical protein CM1200mP13_09440 [Pelagibacterales bacterium]